MKDISLLKVIKPYCSLFLVAFAFGCGGESGIEEAVDQVEKQDNFQSYQLDLRGESIPFAQLIDEIKITRLEETKESLLGYVRQIEFYEDKMVIPSGDEGSIFVFSRTGEFLNTINRRGEGPEDYTGYNDIWLEGDTLALYNYRTSINRYDLEGSFISSDRMLEHAAHLHPYEGGYALDMNYRISQDTLMYSLITLGEDLTIDKTFLPFSKVPGFWVSFTAKTIFPNEEDLLYFPMMSDTVYRIETDSVVPYIHYDFQEDWYFQPGVEVSDAVFTEPEKKGQVWLIFNTIGDDYIYLSTSIGEEFLIERKTGKRIRIDFRSLTDEDYQMTSVAWQGDEFLVGFQSDQLTELLDQLDKSQYYFTEGSTLEEIESSENPALIRIRLKQSEDWK